ncbi:hypothetical protein CROQUDRAFT_85382 [Cronartium quercuum f. sp. fusiforme G11]|uniref:RRM domain-containing protein n=1 Tax=Cronartium quercuum f. sp. fusiforme G11 TaxID=708437 RepID=A0A9P6THB4_9BASI|nr:hypothetical protein CROQUDRAFT_85382 [Cronartium quercuum f. sp. fusiforme G11]
MEPINSILAPPQSIPSSSTSPKTDQQSDHQPPSLDPRIHFDKTTSKWQFEADDGREYEWVESKQAWVPLIDESMWSAQQAAYKVEGVDETTPAQSTIPKDKNQIKLERQLQKQQQRGTKRAHDSNSSQPQRNTAVYVTRLPPDTNVEELSETFSRAGLILVDADNRPKIKLYTDPQSGLFTGSALIVFLKAESVELAIRLFDESPLRIGSNKSTDDQVPMQVSRAEFSHKQNSTSEPTSTGTSQPDQQKKDQLHQKQKRAKKVEKLKSKLEEWDSDDEFGATNDKNNRTVVLQYMFTRDELEADPSLLLDLKEDVREECELLGNVTNVTLYDLESDGIMTVKFKEPIAAQACILKMNNRFFAGRQVKASIDNGQRKFHKTGHGSSSSNLAALQTNPNQGKEEEEKKRLEAFAKYLEEGQ